MKNGRGGKFFDFFSDFGELVELNLLFVLTSLPIFTIGASATAMYKVLIRNRMGDVRPTAKSYFHEFGANFGRSTAIWLIGLVFLVIFGIDFVIFSGADSGIVLLLYGAVLFGLILVSAVTSFALAWTGFFDNTVRQTLSNAVILVWKNIPKALCVSFLSASPVFFVAASPGLIRVWAPLFIFIWFSLTALGSSYFLYDIFKPYLPEDPGEEPGL